MRRIIGVSVLSIVGLVGCASSGSGPDTQAAPPPTQQTTRVMTTGGTGASDLTLTSTPNVGVVTVVAPIDRAWTELISVYAALGIETSTVDQPRRTVGNPSLKVRRRLGTVPLTQYIDCGSTQGAQSAETYEVLLSIHSQLQQTAPNTTTVTTTFQSSARPISISSDYRSCTSTGRLEKRIGELLRTRLGM